jgi:hypothetical protein
VGNTVPEVGDDMSQTTPRRARGRASAVVAAVASVLALVVGVIGTPAAEAASADATILGTTVPAVASDPDTAAVELGVTFIPRVNGSVSGVRFYKGAANTGAHTGSLWNAARSRLATASFTSETASGWQLVQFASPVPVAAGQRYVASYYAPRGRYAAAGGFFKTAYTQGDLTVPVNGGVYRYGTSGFPASTYNATNYYNYYVDLVFRPTGSTPPPPDTRAPVISGVVASAISQTSATISWTTDEPAFAQVAYGKTATYGTNTANNTSLTTSHSQILSGLTASTTYHYQVRSADAAANLANFGRRQLRDCDYSAQRFQSGQPEWRCNCANRDGARRRERA